MKSTRFAWAALAAGGIVCLAFLSSPSGATEYRDPGREVYVAQCAMCHGHSGRGDGRAASDFRSRPADLTDPDLADESDAELIRKIVHARRPMPNFRELMDDREMHEVVGYVRSLSRQQADTP
jgi:mono/diheme cytochrome c family protein